MIIRRQNQKLIQFLGPQYHTYEFFGLKNEYKHINLHKNQQTKGPIILSLMAKALGYTKEANGYASASFIELFCADAYYAMQAFRVGYDEVTGLDSNRDEYSADSEKIAKRLNIPLNFISGDINKVRLTNHYDVVANIGGLYHVENPKLVLKKSYSMARRYLIVQNVVSLESNSKTYFVKPAPGWTWGNRYSRQSFDKLIREELGYKVLDYHFNILIGNDRPCDQGCVYYLIKKK